MRLANVILRKASAYFSQAEFNRPFKRLELPVFGGHLCSPALCDDLTTFGTYTAQMLMAPGAIVKGFYLVRDTARRQRPAFVDLVLVPFLCPPAKEGIGHSVIPAVSWTANARFEVIRTTEPLRVVTTVLTALI